MAGGFFAKLQQGLSKTRENIAKGIDNVFNGYSDIDDDFYEDYYGSSKYLTSNLNGVYKNGDKTIYVYQKDKKTICLLYTIEDVDSFIEPEETSEGVYESDFIDDYYTVTMKDDTMIVEIKSEDKARTDFNGTYKKDSEITKEDILKLYMPR